MRESRCMNLLPQTTLHSDSEQYCTCFSHLQVKNKPPASAFILGPINIQIYSKMSIPLVTDMLRKGTTSL
jgi:hypothetical protein